MAKDGLHAVLVVLSVRSRFSREEEAAIASLRKFFGSKISDYMIVVFTGGDDLEENDETLDDYLGRDCPEPLMVNQSNLICYSFVWMSFLSLTGCILCSLIHFVPLAGSLVIHGYRSSELLYIIMFHSFFFYNHNAGNSENVWE